ncbi:hypothetical protein [Streptomyces sp. NPDC002324]
MSHHHTRKATLRTVAALAVVTAFAAGCTRGSQSGTAGTAADTMGGCLAVLAKAFLSGENRFLGLGPHGHGR